MQDGFEHPDDMEWQATPRRRGRGAASNPANQFLKHHHVEDPAALDEADLRQVKTEFFADTSKSPLSKNNSPDVPFDYGLNPYRGCEHGCIYCYARPSHEYLGYSAGLDFETKIVVKHDIANLLAQAFQKKSWQPKPIMLSGNTDCYQPVERELKLTRGCLEVFAWYRNPVSIITKNYLVTRDIDILAELAERNLISVSISITSLKPEITRVMEPRTSHPLRRLEAIEKLAARGIPVGVMVAPVVPGLTDEELPEIVKAAAERGAKWAHYVMLRLPGAVKELFVDWLGNEFPDRKQRVINRLRDLRGDELTDKRFGQRMRGKGKWAEIISQLHRNTVKQLGLNKERTMLSLEHFRRAGQQDLFSGL
ncbi:MAG: PA0069 family radical SAM protein [Rhodothermales bacterium]